MQIIYILAALILLGWIGPEAGWFPSVWLADPRVKWQAVDEHTAPLFVPFEDKTDVSEYIRARGQ
jgi:hypothetical protein